MEKSRSKQKLWNFHRFEFLRYRCAAQRRPEMNHWTGCTHFSGHISVLPEQLMTTLTAAKTPELATSNDDNRTAYGAMRKPPVKFVRNGGLQKQMDSRVYLGCTTDHTHRFLTLQLQYREDATQEVEYRVFTAERSAIPKELQLSPLGARAVIGYVLTGGGFGFSKGNPPCPSWSLNAWDEDEWRGKSEGIVGPKFKSEASAHNPGWGRPCRAFPKENQKANANSPIG
ncbi:hypothetical protein DFH09DRAFT_1071120 [Mycena vulgaris]|nr:hypothetical protein DFH09DRAFT_1071120 [Mycena vulgaris]